jgi:hypothetical protein
MGPSDAQPPPAAVAVIWQAPAECPSAASVRASTEKLLGRALDAPGLERVVARAQVQKNDVGHWELSLLLAAQGGVSDETLAADECSALADAVALKVALAADPLGAFAVKAPPVPKPEPAGAGAPEPHWTPAPRFGLRPTAGVIGGVLPEVRPALGVFGFLDLTSVRAELGGVFAQGAEARYPEVSEVGATFQLFAGIVRGCAIPGVKTVRLPICAGLEAGVVRGSGFGVSDAASSQRAWGGLSLGPAAIVPLAGAVSLWLGADVTVNLIRPGFRMRNLDTLYRAPLLAGQGWIGVEVVPWR